MRGFQIGTHAKILRLGGRPPRATMVLLLAQFVLFLLFVFTDGPAWVVQHIAQSAGTALGLFELWQPLTAIWLHMEPRGLILNLAILWLFGPALERWWGRRRFVLFYVVTGVSGMILALPLGMIWPNQPVSGSTGSAIALCIACATLFPSHLVHVYRLLGVSVRPVTLGLAGFTFLASLLLAAWLDVAVEVGGALCALAFLHPPTRLLAQWRLKRAKRRFKVIDGDGGGYVN